MSGGMDRVRDMIHRGRSSPTSKSNQKSMRSLCLDIINCVGLKQFEELTIPQFITLATAVNEQKATALDEKKLFLSALTGRRIK